VQAALRRAATRLHVRFEAVNDRVEIDIDDDGSAPATGDLANVGDRLRALGGSILVDANLVRAVIPCG
jgi:signal transduction histidine kinase